MKQKTRIASKLFAALVVLTLISCCFLGTTFARYTSSSSGAAQVEVALWDVDFTASGESTTIDFDVISPNQTGYTTDSADVSNTVNGKTMVTITNNSEVAATVTITVGDVAYATINNAALSETDATWKDNELSGALSESQVDAILKLGIEVTGNGVDVSSSTEDGVTTYTATLDAESSTSQSVVIQASLTWVTAYGSTSTGGAFEDAKDTWIGENIASASVTVNYSAVQASKRP